jgi:hypothetical protein
LFWGSGFEVWRNWRILEQRGARSNTVSKKAMLFLALLLASFAGDFYWGYHTAHSVNDGIAQMFRGLLVLAIILGLYSLRKSN